MVASPLVDTEAGRLAALHDQRILDTPPEEAFDRLVQLAATMLSAPIAAITMIDRTRQWLKARFGTDLVETPREHAFCTHTIQSDDLLVIEDAAADTRFADNPLVHGGPGIRFYAGAPIHDRDGFRLGALCAIDTRPRTLNAAERGALTHLAALASDQLGHRLVQLQAEPVHELRLPAEPLPADATDSVARLQHFLAMASDWLWETDAAHRFVFVSRSELGSKGPSGRMLGQTPWEIMGGNPSTDLLWSQWKAMFDARRPIRRLVLSYLRPGRSPAQIEIRGRPIYDSLGGFAGYRGIGRSITREIAAQRRQLDSEQRLKDYLVTATDWLWETDGEHRLVTVSDPQAFAPKPIPEALGRTHWEIAAADPEAPPWRQHRADLAVRLPFRAVEFQLQGEGAGTVWREISGTPVFGFDGTFGGYRGTVRDITGRKRIEAQLREMTQRLESLAGSNIIGIVVGHGDRIVEANDEFLRMTGYGQADLGDPGLSWRAMTPPEWAAMDDVAEREVLATAACRPFEKELIRKDGSRMPVLFGSVQLDRAENHWMSLLQDISERKAAEARIRELADRDGLTGLLNRRSFQRRLADAMEVRPLDGEATAGGALLLIDLDYFKDINDGLGHDAGDAVLRELGRRLTHAVRRTDVVARLGGDEFAVLLESVRQPADIAAVGRKLHELLQRPVTYDARRLFVGASMGIANFPGDGQDPPELQKNADIALYRSKSAGRGMVTHFEPSMRSALESRITLIDDARRGLAAKEFHHVYQPIQQLDGGRHIGFEALLRWMHPERGMLPPGQFMEALEHSGLIVPLGRQVLDQALANLRGWLDKGLEPGWLALNVAGAQLRSASLVSEIDKGLARHRLAPAWLKIEITENVLIEDSEQLRQTLAKLSAMGVQIALDDFGTGYASLTHLKRLPLGLLKIDRSFVRNAGSDPDDGGISRAIIGLSHSLGMNVVAEGIENDEQLQFLRQNGCDFGQGNFLYQPLAAVEVVDYLRASGRMPGEAVDAAST